MGKNLLSPRRFRKFAIAVSLVFGASILVDVVFIPEAHSEAVPSHLAKMAATLYKSTADDLKLPGKDPKATEMRKRALKILRKAGIHRWAKGAVSFDKDQEKGAARTHSITTGEGEEVELKWSSDSETFLINIKTKPDAKSSEFDITTLKGKVKKKDGADEDMVLDVEPEENPVTTQTSEELSKLRVNILGQWKTEEGHIYTISAADKTTGDIKAQKASQEVDRQIADLKKEIEAFKSEKAFVWKNENSKEVVRQKKFRRLKEPWNYEGEKFAAANAETEIANKEKRIAQILRGKGAGKGHDPTSCKEATASPGARPVKVKIFKPEINLNYEYDSATFNGTKLCAKGKLKDPKDLGTSIPLRIRQKLVANWNPPQWMELDVLQDKDTGGLYLKGNRWRLNVTWTPNESRTDGDIKSTHTPYPKSLCLKRDVLSVEEGAKLSSITITDETFQNELPKVMPGERFWISAKGSGGNSDIVERVRVSVYPEEAGESEWIEVELVETGPDTLEFHSSPEGILVVASEEEEYEEEEIDGEKDEGLPSASSYDPDTGITTTSQRNPDGSRTVIQTDKDGNVISNKTLPPRGKGTSSASSYDPETGITTKSQGNPDGSRTVTRTDKKGKVISSEKVK